MASLWAKMVSAYDQFGYKSDATRKGAMTRDARTKARVVVTDESQWDPRKNDLKGFDDGSKKTAAPRDLAPLRAPVAAPTLPPLVPVVVNKTVAQHAVKKQVYVRSEDVTALPVISRSVTAAMYWLSRKYENKVCVDYYTHEYYSFYQDAVRRNLQAVSKNSGYGGLNQEMQLMEPMKPVSWSGVGHYFTESQYVTFAKCLNYIINQLFVVPMPDAEKMVVYRGTRDVPFTKGVVSGKNSRTKRFMSNYLDSQLQVGETISLSGFTSTTFSPSFAAIVATVGNVEDAESFFQDEPSNLVVSEGTLMQFELPAMYPAMYYPGMGEYEVVLPFTVDSKFRPDAETRHYPMPRWLVTKRDRITIKVREPDVEMDKLKAADWKQAPVSKYITITRVVLRPLLRGTVKF